METKKTIKKSELLKLIKEEGMSRQEIATKYEVPVSRVNAAVTAFGLKGVKKNSSPVEFINDDITETETIN